MSARTSSGRTNQPLSRVKELILAGALISSAFFAKAAGGTVLFSDNFNNSSAWNITSGQLIVAGNIATTQGDANMTTAFASFSQPLGAGDVLQLTFNSNHVTNFATSGWAGISLYTSGTEQVFIGSPGNISSWGLDGPVFGSAIALSRTNEVAEVKFTYNYNTGAWTINVSGDTASGTIASGLAFDQIRIGADINNYADIAVSNLNVVTNSGTDHQTACRAYTWLNGITYSSPTMTAVYTLTGQAVGGGDSITTLDLDFFPAFQYGSGTASSPYLITSKADLKLLSEISCYWNSGFYFKQIAAIKFTSADFANGGNFYNGGKGFIPIGSSSQPFMGTYDGGGYIIDSLYINRPASDTVGFFGDFEGQVNNLGLTNVSVSGRNFVGGLVGNSSTGSISGTFVNGNVSGVSNVGGLAGRQISLTDNSYSRANVTGNSIVGGLIGLASSTIYPCSVYSTGSVTGSVNVGGLVGMGSGSGTCTNYWDTQTSGQSTSGIGTGETTVQMQTQATFAQWDFVGETTNGTNDYWYMPSCADGNYPILTWQAFQGGTGTSTDPFLILSKADLKTLSENPCLWSHSYEQPVDLVFTAADFQPGGDFYNGGSGFSPIGNQTIKFTGNYTGDGHSIDSLTINRPADYHVSLFGYLDGGQVSKLEMKNVSIAGQNNVSGLVGYNNGAIVQCSATGTVSAAQYSAGGIVGFDLNGSITNCYSTVSVSATLGRAGGLLGFNDSGVLTDCYAASPVSAPLNAGGLVGEVQGGGINSCFWNSDLFSPSNGYGTGKTTAEMQTMSTFTTATWDFVNETTNGTNDIWQMGGCLNNNYPVFSWQHALEIPVITSTQPTTSCYEGSVNLYAYASVGNPVWYNAPTGGTALYTGSGFYTPSLNSTTSFWVGADNNGCLSLTRTEVVVSYYAPFSASATAAAAQPEICDSGATTITLSESSSSHFYYLYNYPDYTIANGPFAGTGSTLSFNTGTISATSEYVIYGVRDFGMGLPANNDHVRFSSPFYAYGSEISIEAWVKVVNGEFPWAGQSTPGLDDMNNNVWLWQSGTFSVNDNGTWRNLTFPALGDGWVHIATVANASGMYIYYGDTLAASSASGISTGITNNSSSVIDLGQDPRFPDGTAGKNSNVAFDNFKIWKVARTQNDIQVDKAWCDITGEPNLVLNTRFEDGTGTTVTSQTGPNGTIQNPSNNWVLGSESCPLCNTELPNHVIVTVNQTPVADSLNNLTACDSVALPALSSGNYYTSSGGNGTMFSAGDHVTSSQTLFIYAHNGGCSDQTTFSVTINATPDITTTLNGTTITSNATGVSYQWVNCNNGYAPISAQTNQSFTAGANGNYAVIVTNGSCVDTSTCVAITGVGISSRTLPGVTIYPNPTQGKIMVTLEKGKSASIVIRNVFGQLIASKEMTNASEAELNINEPAGIYFVEITNSDNERSVIRVVKE